MYSVVTGFHCKLSVFITLFLKKYIKRERDCVFVFASIFVRPKLRERILSGLDAYEIINF